MIKPQLHIERKRQLRVLGLSWLMLCDLNTGVPNHVAVKTTYVADLQPRYQGLSTFHSQEREEETQEKPL